MTNHHEICKWHYWGCNLVAKWCQWVQTTHDFVNCHIRMVSGAAILMGVFKIWIVTIFLVGVHRSPLNYWTDWSNFGLLSWDWYQTKRLGRGKVSGWFLSSFFFESPTGVADGVAWLGPQCRGAERKREVFLPEILKTLMIRFMICLFSQFSCVGQLPKKWKKQLCWAGVDICFPEPPMLPNQCPRATHR